MFYTEGRINSIKIDENSENVLFQLTPEPEFETRHGNSIKILLIEDSNDENKTIIQARLISSEFWFTCNKSTAFYQYIKPELIVSSPKIRLVLDDQKMNGSNDKQTTPQKPTNIFNVTSLTFKK